MDLSVRVLGRLEVLVAGESATIGGPKQRTALALILDADGTRVSVDRLVQGVYGPDAPERSKRSIHTFVANLRRVFGDAIRGDGTGYLLDPVLVDIDARRFGELVEQGLVDVYAQPSAASALLAESLDLWDGDRPYGDVDAFGALEATRTRLTELRLRALAARVEADLRLGRHDAVIPELSELVKRHPLMEALHGHLMLALYRAGRQTEAVRAFEDARRLLLDSTGLDPSPSLVALCEKILEHDASLQLTSTRFGVVPARTTSFVGRDGELRRVVDLLRAHRLVTIIGPGGVGKTSLAIEASRVLARDVSGPVAFVDLATASSQLAVEVAVGHGLNVDERTGSAMRSIITGAVGRSAALLVLDTCEHVVGSAASLIVELLRHCPNLRVLATSRRSLRAEGELTFTLNPLSTTSSAGLSDAARLLADRFRLASPESPIAAQSEGAVEFIAKRLDGLPLAIEIVAARAKWFGLEGVATQVTDSGGAMLDEPRRGGDERHSSLARAVEWSVELLTRDGQAAFAALGVFPHGFSAQDAHGLFERMSLATAPDELLVELLDASLLNREPEETTRYSMLDTIRAVAFRRLEQSDIQQSVRRAFAENTLANLESRADQVAANRIPPSLEADVRSSVDWAMDADPQLALALTGAAAKWYWHFGSRLTGYEILKDAVERFTMQRDSAGQRVAEWLSMFAAFYGHQSLATEWLQFAISASEEIDEPQAVTSALRVAAFVAASNQEISEAIASSEKALGIDTAAGDLLAVARDLRNLATWSDYQGNPTRLEEVADRYDELDGPFGHPKGLPLPDRWRAAAAIHRDDLRHALRLLSPVVDAMPPEAGSTALELVRRAEIHAWLGDTMNAQQDLDLLAGTDHLTSAPWAMEMRQHVASAQAAIYREAGDLAAAAGALRRPIRESLQFLNVLEVQIATLPRMLIEATAILAGTGRFGPAVTLGAALRRHVLEAGRALPPALQRALDEADESARRHLDERTYAAAAAAPTGLSIDSAARFAAEELTVSNA